VAAGRRGEHLGGEDLLFAPDEDVFERVRNGVLARQPLVDGVEVVNEDDVEVGVELDHLVVVERGEQPVLPAERRVRVDDHRVVLLDFCQDVLEHRATQRRQARQRQIKDAAGPHIGRLGVHEIADVEHAHRLAARFGQTGDFVQVRFLVHADLAGDDDPPARMPPGTEEAGL
jgi:hypothetical protein